MGYSLYGFIPFFKKVYLVSDNIYIGITDSYQGWLSGYVNYFDGDDVVGYVNFQLNQTEKEIYIDMIQVDDNYKRQGIATKMLYRLRDEYPDYYVDWGMTTDDGTKLYNKLCRTDPNPEYFRIKKTIDACEELLKNLEVKLNDDDWLENTPQDVIEKTANRWDKINSKKHDLEYDIQDMRDYITVWR